MISDLRKHVHIIEKESLEGITSKRIPKAKELFSKHKDELTEEERLWCKSVLYHEQQKDSEAKGVIYTRRSVRKWKDRKVPEDKIKELLSAANYAPSSCNRQPIEIILTDKTKEISEYKKQKFISRAPQLLIILVNLSIYNIDKTYFACLDAGAAIQNILLRAHQLGLGACWINAAPQEGGISQIRKLFDIPDNFMIASFVCIGYPDHLPKTPGRKELKLRYDSYTSLRA